MTQPRRIIWLMTLVVGLVYVEGGARNADASPQDQGQNQGQQQQPGSYFVGHATRVLNVTGTRDETRNVNVHLWYPAPGPQNCQSGDGGSQGCPPSVYTSRLHGVPLLLQWDPLRWTIRGRRSFEGLPLSSAQSSYPVIIFSHGNQGNAIDYVYTLEALASLGYIVAAPDHVNNTQDDVRIDFINAKARTVTGDPNFTLIPCFDGLPSPCDVTSRVKAEHSGSDPVVSCPLGSLVNSTTASVLESMTDRVRDVSAVIDALPIWFGSRADASRIGVMGHSRGTVTALAAVGGSAAAADANGCWGFPADARVKAIMGLAIGAQNITLGVDLPNVTVPTLLVAGELDVTSPLAVSQLALSKISSSDKKLVMIPNAKHRHFDCGLCAQTQSSGAIAQTAEAIVGAPSTTRAILDLQTTCTLVTSTPSSCTDVTYGPSGVSMEFCELDTFTSPTDIQPLVTSLTGFNFASTTVPTTGLSSDQVKEQVIELAVAFFGRVL
jgi:predicted dienelactone hydrolase